MKNVLSAQWKKWYEENFDLFEKYLISKNIYLECICVFLSINKPFYDNQIGRDT